LKRKILFLFAFLLLFSIVGRIAVATVQGPLIALSSTELTFHSEEGSTKTVTSSFVIVALENVTVKIVDTKLYDNTSGEAISITAISDDYFDLTRNDNKTITLTLNPSGVKAGTYEGVLMITATNKTTTAEIFTTNIKVTAKITSLLYNVVTQIVLITLTIVPIFAGLLMPDTEPPKYKLSKRSWLVVFAAISVFFWLLSIVSLSFKEPGTIINTILVAPFLTYVISFVKDTRTERLEREKASGEIRAKGLEKDIELIRNVIGEVATHWASFNPHLYTPEVRPLKNAPVKQKGQTTAYDDDCRILFNKSGIISREVWDKSCKQGIVADLPVLELEKYYDFIEFYNRYYSKAIALTKDKKPSEIEKADFDFEKFQEFREAYGELETVIFVYLTYILGYLSKTYLSPLKVTYRRVTRTLLLRLIEYGILEPEQYTEQIQCYVTYHCEDADYQKYLEARKAELKKQSLSDAEKEMETFKFIIIKWHFDADDLEDIYEEIYSQKNIPRVLRKVADDFEKKYVTLKDSVKNLQPKIEYETEKPDKKRIEMSGHLAVLKDDKAIETLKTTLETAAKKAEDAAKKAETAAKRAETAANSKTKTK
jgi:hypothetical protein